MHVSCLTLQIMIKPNCWDICNMHVFFCLVYYTFTWKVIILTTIPVWTRMMRKSCHAHMNSAGFVDCSHGVGRRKLSSMPRHRNSGRFLSRLHAAARACIQTSRWVLVPGCSHRTKPDLSIYRNVRMNLSHKTVFVILYWLHLLPVCCYMICCCKKLFFVHGPLWWIFWSCCWSIEMNPCYQKTASQAFLGQLKLTLLFWFQLFSPLGYLPIKQW